MPAEKVRLRRPFPKFTLFPSRPRGAPGRETAQGNLAQQGFRIRRTCRRIRITFGGLRPSKPPGRVFDSLRIYVYSNTNKMKSHMEIREKAAGHAAGALPRSMEQPAKVLFRGLGVSKKSACGVLFRNLRRFPLAPMGPTCGKRRKETLLRKLANPPHMSPDRLAFGGLRPSKPPKEVFGQSGRLKRCGSDRFRFRRAPGPLRF